MLHWKKVATSRISADSVWAGKTVTSDISEHTDDLVGLFFEDTTKKAKPAARAVAAKKKNATVALLDMQRSNNIAIALSRFKATNEQICEAIISLDELLLSLEQLQMLLSLLPNTEELKMLRAFKGDAEKLGVSERFLLLMSKIPKCEARVQGFIFKQEFNSRKDELKQQVTKVAGITKKVIDNQKFKGVLEITLALGNFMNSGHHLGNAGGFSIESVLMLSVKPRPRSAGNHGLALHRCSCICRQLMCVRERAEHPCREQEDLADALPCRAGGHKGAPTARLCRRPPRVCRGAGHLRRRAEAGDEGAARVLR
jgi:hypothetical protein